jgi:hypothetical protein
MSGQETQPDQEKNISSSQAKPRRIKIATKLVQWVIVKGQSCVGSRIPETERRQQSYRVGLGDSIEKTDLQAKLRRIRLD